MQTILPKENYLLKNGKILPFGVYDDIITHPHTSFWDKDGIFSMRRFTERKTWIFYGVYSPDLFAGIAIVDAGMVSTAFAYFYIPSKNLFIEDKVTLPLQFGPKFDPSLDNNWQLGTYNINTLNGKMHFAHRGKFNLNIVADMNNDGLSIVAPSQERPFNYTYKNLPMYVDVHIEYKGEKISLSGNYGAIDFTKGYPPRSTKWNWSSAIGTTASGKVMAFNLVKYFNDELENILWYDGNRYLLDKSNYTLPGQLNKEKWHVSTQDMAIDTDFFPLGARSENLDIKFMKSIFTQPFGRYEGTINIAGIREDFTSYGVCEDHLAVW